LVEEAQASGPSEVAHAGTQKSFVDRKSFEAKWKARSR
jgi:hypothetical protein